MNSVNQTHDEIASRRDHSGSLVEENHAGAPPTCKALQTRDLQGGGPYDPRHRREAERERIDGYVTQTNFGLYMDLAAQGSPLSAVMDTC